MATRSNRNPSAAELRRSPTLARSVLRETASRMISSVERSALAEIYAGGKRRTHTPEEFLAAFKAALHDATEYAGITAGPEREALLSDLVAMCMEDLISPDIRFDGANTMSVGVDRVAGWT
jgi:hypothetical protein